MFSREGFERSSYWGLARASGGMSVARWRYGDDGVCRISFHDFASTVDRDARQWSVAVPADEAWDEVFSRLVESMVPMVLRQQEEVAGRDVRRDVTICRLSSLPDDCDPYLLHFGKGRTSHVHFFMDRMDEGRILVASATEVYGDLEREEVVQAEKDEWGRWIQTEVDYDLAADYARYASAWGRRAVAGLERHVEMGMSR